MDLLLASTIPFAQETLSSSLNVLLVNLFTWLLSLNCPFQGELILKLGSNHVKFTLF